MWFIFSRPVGYRRHVTYVYFQFPCGSVTLDARFNPCYSRLEYNSMGERVLVEVPLANIDAFAVRHRQQHSNGSRVEGKPTYADDGAGEGQTPSGVPGLRADSEPQRPLESLESGELSPATANSLIVSKNLTFADFPDYSSVGSRVAEQARLFWEGASAYPQTTRASAAQLGEIPAGFRDVWSRQDVVACSASGRKNGTIHCTFGLCQRKTTSQFMALQANKSIPPPGQRAMLQFSPLVLCWKRLTGWTNREKVYGRGFGFL